MEGISAHELQGLILSVGTHRGARPQSPVEVGQLIQRAMSSGVSIQDIAGKLKIGRTQVSAFLKLLDLTKEIQHLRTGEVPATRRFRSHLLPKLLDSILLNRSRSLRQSWRIV